MPAGSPPAPGLAEVAVEVSYYVAVSLPVAIGLTVAVLAVPEARGGIVVRHVRGLASCAAILVLVVAAGQFFTAAARSAHSGLADVVNVKAVAAFVASAPSRGHVLGNGASAALQFAVLVLAAAGLVAMRNRPSRWLAGTVAATALVSAILPEIPSSLSPVSALAVDTLTAAHITGALLWVGGLVVLSAVGVVSRRNRATTDAETQQQIAADWYQIWERFSTVALWAVGALVVSGAWLAWSHVGSPGQLVTTAYGRHLAIKLVLVLALLVAGGYNTRVLLPKVRAAQRDGQTRALVRVAVEHFPLVVLVEALVALGVLFVVPFLRGSARSEAGWPAARPFDLTVFASGAALVALVATALWAGSRTPGAGGRRAAAAEMTHDAT